MATTPKTKRNTKAAGSKIISSKKKGFNKKQWTIFGGICAVLLTIGSYFALQHYLNPTSNAAGWKSLGQIKLSTVPNSSNSYALFTGYTCKSPTTTAGLYTVKVKLQINLVKSIYAKTDTRLANIYANQLQLNFKSKSASGKNLSNYSVPIWPIGGGSPTLSTFTYKIGSFSTKLRSTDTVSFMGWVSGYSIRNGLSSSVSSINNC